MAEIERIFDSDRSTRTIDEPTDPLLLSQEEYRRNDQACRHAACELSRIPDAHLSWDAASWHISKELAEHLDEINSTAETDGVPIIKTMPLPAGAQFLNVIESVFSGMARAIIHNSDYPWPSLRLKPSTAHRTRNAHFRKHPQRAGKRFGAKSVSRVSLRKNIIAKIRCTCFRSKEEIDLRLESPERVVDMTGGSSEHALETYFQLNRCISERSCCLIMMLA